MFCSGLFTYSEETRCHWFRPGGGPPERDAQYTLVGIVLGLAIYNSVILDVRLPMVVYRKLSGRRGGLEDLDELSPVRTAQRYTREYRGLIVIATINSTEAVFCL